MASGTNSTTEAGWTAYLLLAGGMAVFGSATPVSKLVTAGLPVFVGSALRALIGAAVLLPFVLTGFVGRCDDDDADGRQDLCGVKRKDALVVGAVAVVGMFGFSVLMLYGMRRVSGVVGSIVMSTTPAVTAAASVAFLRDRFTVRRAGAIALAVAGVLIVHIGGRGGHQGAGYDLIGVALVFGAVCAEAAYTLLGKVATTRLSPVRLSFLAAALSVPLFVVPAALEIRGLDLANVPWTAWAAAGWWGAGTLGLGSVLWYSGVSRVPGSVAAGFMGVMPVSALVLSYGLLGEPFRIGHILGFAVVLSGVLLISWSHAADPDASS